MSLSLPRSDLIASASCPERIPTCSAGAAAMSSDAVCGQAPTCASAGRLAGQQMQTSKIANRRGWRNTCANGVYPAEYDNRNVILRHSHNVGAGEARTQTLEPGTTFHLRGQPQ